MLAILAGAEAFLAGLQEINAAQMVKQRTTIPKLEIRLMSMRKIVANEACTSRNAANKLKCMAACETFPAGGHPTDDGESYGQGILGGNTDCRE